MGQNSSAHSKGLEQPLFDDSRVHICVPSHLSSELLSVSVCLSAGCLGLSPHLGHLSPRAHQPLIGADRTRYPPTLLHQPSVLPYILWTTPFIISFWYLRTTSSLMRRQSLKVANLFSLQLLPLSKKPTQRKGPFVKGVFWPFAQILISEI